MNCIKEEIDTRIISCSEARQNLSATMMKVIEDHAPILIIRQSGEVCVLTPLEECNSLEETAYLLHSSANARRLMDPIDSLKSGKGTEKDAIE